MSPLATGIRVGEKAPDFTLSSGSGDKVTLSEALKEGPVVLVWYHLAFTGGWQTELQSIQQVLDQLSRKGARVYGLSIDSQFVQGEFAKHCGLSYPLLGDPNREASRAYRVVLEEPLAGIRDVTDRAVFVVGRDGSVRYAWIGDIKGQPDAAAVVSAVA